jgi:hypothetical protein
MKKNAISAGSVRVLFAIVIALILLAAAIVKILYPSLLLKNLFMAVSVFEIALACGLLCFARRWQAWAVLVLVFAAFAGYSLYLAIFGLPCPCLGLALKLPLGSSLIVNIVILACGWFVLKRYDRIPSRRAHWILVSSIVLLVIGYLVALSVYS